MFFTIIILIVIIQRLVELFAAKKNEKWIIQQGGYEVGASHYPLMVLMHSAFFAVLIAEVALFERSLSPGWILLLTLFLLAQAGRFWCLFSLGKFWNTKIMILPHANIVQKGPYQLMRHPNYFIVTVELLALPLLFSAYFTAVLFTLLNIGMLSIRIPIEEKALRKVTDYENLFDKSA